MILLSKININFCTETRLYKSVHLNCHLNYNVEYILIRFIHLFLLNIFANQSREHVYDTRQKSVQKVTSIVTMLSLYTIHYLTHAREQCG